MRRRSPYLHSRHGIHYFFWNDPKTGKRHEESLRTRDLDIAEERYGQRIEEIRNGLNPAKQARWPLAVYVEHWLDSRRDRLSRASFAAEVTVCRNLQAFFKGNVRLEE